VMVDVFVFTSLITDLRLMLEIRVHHLESQPFIVLCPTSSNSRLWVAKDILGWLASRRPTRSSVCLFFCTVIRNLRVQPRGWPEAGGTQVWPASKTTEAGVPSYNR
jgi:hypothetical protein